MSDVLITPASKKIEFKDGSSNIDGTIKLDANDNLVLTSANDLVLGDGSTDLHIGDGTNSIDMVFDQSGRIYGAASKDITIGKSSLGSNDIIVDSPNWSVTSAGAATFAGGVASDLHVSGDTTIWDGTNEAHLILRRNATGANYGSAIKFQFGDSGTDGSASSGHEYARITGNIEDSTNTDEDGYMTFSTSLAGTLAEKMRIKSDGTLEQMKDTNAIAYHGRAAIGYCGHSNYAAFGHLDVFDTTGYALLQYQDGTTYLNSETGKNIYFRVNNSTKMMLKSDGNFGIGETSPLEKLHVGGDIRADGQFLVEDQAGDFYMMQLTSADASSDFNVGMHFQGSPNTLDFHNGYGDITLKPGTGGSLSTSYLTVKSDGKVGIGTGSPTDSLAVRGGIKIGEFNDTDGTGYAASAAPSSANLGTGASDPQIRVSGRSTGNPGIIQMAHFDANNFFGGTTEFVLGRLQYAMNENSQEVTTVAEIRGITSKTNDPGHFDGALTFLTSQGDGSSANLTEKMILTADGNLGIGTTTPETLLDIDDSSFPKMRFSRGTSYWWEIGHTSSDFQFNSQTGGTIMHMNYDGNVGIGTTSPDAPLHVSSSGVSDTLLVESTNVDGANAAPDIVFYRNPSSGGGETGDYTGNIEFRGLNDNASPQDVVYSKMHTYIIDATDGAEDGMIMFDVMTNGTSREKMRIRESMVEVNALARSDCDFRIRASGVSDLFFADSSTGRVGIGTNSPVAPLTVETATNDVEALRVQNSAGNPGGVKGVTRLGISSRLESVAGAQIIVKEMDVADYRTNMYFATKGTNVSDDPVTERMTIKYDGNVGIGDTTPSYKLDVAGTGRFTGTLRIENTLPELRLIDTDATNDPTARIINNNGGLSIRADSENVGTGGFIDFTTSGTERMRLTDAGNLGISTTSPAGKFQVVQDNFQFSIIAGADVSATSLTNDTRKYARIGMPHYHTAEEPVVMMVGDSDGTNNYVKIGGGTSAGNAATTITFNTAADDATTTGTERMRIDSAGNVGIGDSDPSTELDVDGTVSATGHRGVRPYFFKMKKHASSDTTNRQDISTTSVIAITWHDADANNDDDVYTYSGGNTTRISVDKDGFYLCNWNITWSNNNSGSNRATIVGSIYVNGTQQVDSKAYGYSRGNAYGNFNHCGDSYGLFLEAGDYIEIKTKGVDFDDASDPVYTLSKQCHVTMMGWPDRGT